MENSQGSIFEIHENLIAWISLLIAVYAAVIGTINAYREHNRDSKRLLITLRHVDFEERFELVLENIGFRPLSIANISLELMFLQNGRKFYDKVPTGSLFEDSTSFSVPLVLKEGEIKIIKIQNVIAGRLSENPKNARIVVYDNAGNRYTKFSINHRDPKWGDITS